MRQTLGRTTLVVAAMIATLAVAPPDALAMRVALNGSDSADGQRYFQAAVQAAGGETNDLKVNLASGVIEDDGAKIEIVGSRADDECRSSNARRRVTCPQLNRALIATGDGDDRITVFGYTCRSRACAFGKENLDSGPEVSIDPGPGRDEVRLDWGATGEVVMSLRDGAKDTISCNGRAVDLEIRTRDSEDDVRNCPRPRGSPPSGDDAAPPRATLSARRVQSRAGVARLGIGTLCSSTREGTCSVTASISARAARALGIRTRARRYTIARGSASVSGPGRTKVSARLSPRARGALNRRRPAGLRVLLTAVVRDSAGRASSARFTVTLRG